MQNISLADCRYIAKTKTLIVNSMVFSGRFPREFTVESHHTGNKIKFKPIGPEHSRFDPDHWDGEQMLYEPTTRLNTVNVLILSHGC